MNKMIKYGINFIISDNYIDDFKKYLEKKQYGVIYNINFENSSLLNVIVKKYNSNYNFICKDKNYKDILSIIKDEKICIKMYTEKLNIDQYKRDLARLEHIKNNEYNKILKYYNSIFQRNFDVNNGLNDIYEWYTGAIYFKDYEWEEIQNNKIKSLFEIKKNNSYIYALPLDNGIILRGPDIYYYFSSDISRFEKPTIIEIKKWFGNVSKYLKLVLNILDDYSISNNYDKRLLLALLDNIRNIILLLTNCELMNLYKGQDFIYHSTYNNNIIEAYFALINDYQREIEYICYHKNCDDKAINEIYYIYKTVLKMLNNTYLVVENINDEFILSKCFNPLREIDNYFENYIVCEYIVNEKIGNYKNQKINLIGILYGGLELPFIIKRLTANQSTIGFLFQNHGMYLDRQQKNRDSIVVNLMEYGTINKMNDTYIIDDNMMSGITMQFAYNQLYLNEFNNIKGILVVRHPNLNRVAQLKYFDTALNLSLVDKYIYGMLTDTPYTKIKSGTNYNNMFVNELNIFSVMTEVFLKALYCNNSFKKNSQVDIFLGYSEGKND